MSHDRAARHMLAIIFFHRHFEASQKTYDLRSSHRADFTLVTFYETQQSPKNMKQDTEDTVFNHASVNVLDFCKSGGFMKTVHGDGEWTEHHTQCHHYTL